MYKLLAFVLVAVCAATTSAQVKRLGKTNDKATEKATEPAAKVIKPVDPKVSDADRRIAIEWVTEHCIYDGWEAKRWEYQGELRSSYTGKKWMRVYIMRFAPKMRLDDVFYDELWFFFEGQRLHHPRPDVVANMPVGVNPQPFADFGDAVLKMDIFGPKPKVKPKGPIITDEWR
jgi:hypothetical protein